MQPLKEIAFDIPYFIDRILFISRYIPKTMVLALTAMVFGLLFGTIIAILRHRRTKIIYYPLTIYVSFFRGTPLVVQLFLIYFGLPQVFPALSVVDAMTMSVIVLALNASAYLSETVRASINAIDKDQMEAALSIGMTKSQAMRRIILPQAFRIAIPPLGNTFINLTQGTAITFTIGVAEMMGITKIGAAASYKFLESYLAVGILYWILTLIITWLITLFERRLARAY